MAFLDKLKKKDGSWNVGLIMALIVAVLAIAGAAFGVYYSYGVAARIAPLAVVDQGRSGRFDAPPGRPGLQFIPSSAEADVQSNFGKTSSEYAVPPGGFAPQPRPSPGLQSEIQQALQQSEFAGLNVQGRNGNRAKLKDLLNYPRVMIDGKLHWNTSALGPNPGDLPDNFYEAYNTIQYPAVATEVP